MSYTIAIAINDIVDGYQRPIVNGVRAYCQQHNIRLEIHVSAMYIGEGGQGAYGGLMFDLITQTECKGVIIPIQIFSSLANKFDPIAIIQKNPNIKINLIGGQPHNNQPSINADNSSAIIEAITHFKGIHQFKKIGWIGGPEFNNDAIERLNAFKQGLLKNDLQINDDYIFGGAFHYSSGVKAIKELLKCPDNLPDAMLAADDYTALGAIDEIRRHSLNIKVIGFDNIFEANLSNPKLSTIDPNLERVGWLAAQNLCAQIDEAPFQQETTVPTKFVLRHSCGCLENHDNNIILFPKNDISIDFSTGEVQALTMSLVDYLEHSNIDKPIILNDIESLIKVIFEELKGNLSEQPIEDLLERITLKTKNHTKLQSWHRIFKEVYSFFQLRNLNAQQHIFLKSIRFNVGRFFHKKITILRQQALFSKQENNNQLNSMTQAIDRCFTQEDLLNTLKAFLLVFDIEEFVVGLFKSHTLFEPLPSQAPKWSSIIYDHQQSNHSHNEVINTASFKPYTSDTGLDNPQDSEQYYILPLNHKRLQFGYIYCTANPELLHIYEAIKFHIGFTLKNIFTIERSTQDERKLKVAMAQLTGSNQSLAKQSISDQLTGLLNRRGFMESAKNYCEFAKQNKQFFILLFADLDGLKAINDTYGHQVGDETIKQAAQVLKASFRRTDIICRLAGDEFVIILVDTDATSVAPTIAKIHHISQKFNLKSGLDSNLDFSVGVSLFDPEKPVEIEELMSIADNQLYDIKSWKKEHPFD